MQDWNSAMNQFAIVYENRLPRELRVALKCRKSIYKKTGQWKLSLYGNRGKTKDVFPPFPQRLENSPGMDEFSTVTTAPTTGTKREQKQVPRKTVYTKDLTPPRLKAVLRTRFRLKAVLRTR